jgi:hypothetical protein
LIPRAFFSRVEGKKGNYLVKTNGIWFGFLRTTTAAALALSMLVPAAAQTRRQAPQKSGGAATSPAPPRAGAGQVAGQVATAEPPVDLTKLVPSPRSKALGAAYASGSLPSPAPLPAGSVEQQAAALAARLGAGDEGSVPALYAAVLASGFGVREQGGGVRRPADGAGQGLAFEAWQLATTAKLYGDGYAVGLGRVAAALAVAEPGFAGAPFGEMLVEDVRRAALSENRATRFWALFVVELGRQAEQPYDLLGDDDLSRVRLDAVQLSFILTRLAADLHVLSKKGQPAARTESRRRDGVRFAAASYGDTPGRATRAPFTFTRASFGRETPAAAPAVVQEAGAAAAQPCQLNEIESIILDYNATATTTAFGSLMGYLEGKGVGAAGKWAGLAGKANVVLTLLKFLATYAAVNAEVTLDGGMLTRTKTTRDGERRMLTAKLVIDTGKWQALNCLRPALNAAGLDFSLPGSGAMAGVRVQWRLVAGGDTRGYLGRAWHTASNLDRILEGKAVGNDGGAVVYLDTAAGATRAEDKHHYNYTDDNGESKIPAVGHAQEKDLSKEKLKVVYKPLGVKVEIQIKTMKIKDAKGAAGTLGDLAGNVLAALTGDLWGAGVGLGAETAYRANWYPSKEFYFPVKDWAPCDGGWRGTVDVVQELREDVAETKRDPVSGQTTIHTSTRIHAYAAKVTVAPGAEEGALKTSAVAGLSDRTYSFESTMFYEHCGDSRRLFTNDGRWTKYVEGNTVEADPNFNVNEKAPGLFNLSVGIGGFTAAYTDRQQVSFKNHCEEYCDHKPSDETTKGEESVERVAVMLEDLKADPEDPNTLKGTRTFDEMGFKITVTWNLTRCQ